MNTQESNSSSLGCLFKWRIWSAVFILSLLFVHTSVLLADDPPDWVNAADYGWHHTDATYSLQTAINTGAQTVFVPNMGTDWIVRPIFLNSSNQTILFEDGVVVTAKRGEYLAKNASLFTGISKSNISLTGGNGVTFRMWKDDYTSDPYEDSEWRMGIRLYSCTDVVIEGLTIRETGGDGIYLGTHTQEDNISKNIVIKDVTCVDNYRLGICVSNAENLLIDNCILNSSSGIASQSGIDFEPNDSFEKIVNCVVSNSILNVNAESGVSIYLEQLPDYGRDSSITFDNCTFVGNTESGLTQAYSLGLTIKDSIFVLNGMYGVERWGDAGYPDTVVEYSAFWGNTSGPVGGYVVLGTGNVTGIVPAFESMDVNSPFYMYLAEDCPTAITEGASDGGYMGARPVGPPTALGDVNRDGLVDDLDATMIIGNLNMSGTYGIDIFHDDGDLTADGNVNSDDLLEVKANWGYGVVPPEPPYDGIPEPSTFLLLAGGVLAGLIRRR